MRAVVDKKYRFFIAGLHRTGTTITTAIFDSLDNGVCWGEPHWHHFINDDDSFDFFDDQDCEWDLCGYKETYKLVLPDREYCDLVIERHIPVVDFFIVVFRDPLMAHSSMKKRGMVYMTPELFVEGYERLDELAHHEKGIAVVLEDMIDGGLDYLNGRLPFQTEGPLVVRPVRSRQYMGDERAVLRSTGLSHTKRKVLLNGLEILAHERSIEIWKSHMV